MKCVPERPEGSHICWEHHLIYYRLDSQRLLVLLWQFFNATFPVLVRHSASAEGAAFVEHGAGHCKLARERDLLTGSARPSLHPRWVSESDPLTHHKHDWVPGTVLGALQRGPHLPVTTSQRGEHSPSHRQEAQTGKSLQPQIHTRP